MRFVENPLEPISRGYGYHPSFTNLPRLKQQLPTRARLFHKTFFAREDSLASQPSLSNHTLEGFILVRRDFVPKEHGTGLNLA